MKSRIVNPTSLEERKKVVLSAYADIDSEIERQHQARPVKTICHTKCHGCCSDYFYVSLSEFSVIIDYIKLHSLNLESIIAKSHQYREDLLNRFPVEYDKLNRKRKGVDIKTIDNMYNDNDVPNGIYPCPLLNDVGECMVYPVRTLICRYEGIDCNHAGCPTILKKISNGIFKKRINEKKLVEHTYQLQPIQNYLIAFDSATHLGQTRAFAVAPLFWWFDIYHEIEQEKQK